MPTKVVHILSSFQVGGAERFALDLSQIQSKSHHVSIFATSTSSGPLLQEATAKGTKAEYSSGSKLRDLAYLRSEFNHHSSKIIHIHSPAAIKYLLFLLPLMKIMGITIIYTRHGIAPLDSLKWKVVHQFANVFVSWVTFVSKVGLETFYKHHKWARKKHIVIRNGALIPDSIQPFTSDGIIKIGSVGRMIPLKGQKFLIDAVKNVRHKITDKVELHFFGDGPTMQDLKSLSKASGFGNETYFHGVELNREKVYANIDILVVCSEQEGLSLAILEAMAQKIPVIATEVGDSPKLVISNKTGYLYEYGDTQKLSEFLIRLCNKAEVRKQLSEGAHAHVLKNYSLEKTHTIYQQYYHPK